MNLNSTSKKIRFGLLAAFAGLMIAMVPNTAVAQNGGSETDAMVSDFLNIYNFTADKVVQLGNAIPVEKYSWRPAEGIRSVKESMMHVASANYFFGSMLGAKMPEGMNPQTLEKKEMSKEEAIKILNESIAFARDAVKNMDPSKMDDTVSFAGNEFNKRQVIFIIGDHVAEHLGQLIAYARSNGVVPPWSQTQ